MTRPASSQPVNPSNHQKQYLSNAGSAALHGATSAFKRPKNDVPFDFSNGTRSYGAVSAAAFVGRGNQSVKQSAVPASISNHMGPIAHQRHGPIPEHGGGMPHAGTVGEVKARLGLLEAAGETSAPRAIVQTVPKTNVSLPANERTDSTSIAPTTTLVRLFESGTSSKQDADTGTSILGSRGPAPPIRSPKPIRVLSHNNGGKNPGQKHPDSVEQGVMSIPTQASSFAKPIKPARSADAASTSILDASTVSSVLKLDGGGNDRTGDLSLQAALRPAPEQRIARSGVEPPGTSGQKPDNGALKAQSLLSPPIPPPRHTRAETTACTLTQHPVATAKPLPKAATAQGQGQLQSLSQRRVTPHMTGDSLANAIVGAALASSRVPTPARTPDPRPALPKRHTTSHHAFHLHHHKSRTPSPNKGFTRTTMRKEPSSSDEEIISRGAKPKGMFARKHPNKHHEGSRKRWRDEVTERERKRYEGVWAANKGLYIPFAAIELAFLARHNSSPAEAGKDLVSNLVVRDIWSRSRLPSLVLEEVWDLVDNEGKGRLSREEFVVGLWLVDQRLKGRKLPVRVGESVWASVRTVKGVILPRKIK